MSLSFGLMANIAEGLGIKQMPMANVTLMAACGVFTILHFGNNVYDEQKTTKEKASVECVLVQMEK